LKNHINNIGSIGSRDTAIKSLVKQGKSALLALTELLSSKILINSDREIINKGIQELSS